MKAIIMAVVLVVMMAMSGMAAAGVQEDWPMGTSNEYDGQHVMIDFEEGNASYDLVTSTIPWIEFVAMDSNPWIYGCRDGLNIFDENNTWGAYVVNGYSGAWCNTPGNRGKITFARNVNHVSLLVSTHSGVEIDAFNSSGAIIANSDRAERNLRTQNFTRLSVDREEFDIAYVVIHDTGNYWIMDDLIVGYSNGKSSIAHCQKFIHSQGQDHWNESAWMNKTHPCNYTV